MLNLRVARKAPNDQAHLPAGHRRGYRSKNRYIPCRSGAAIGTALHDFLGGVNPEPDCDRRMARLIQPGHAEPAIAA